MEENIVSLDLFLDYVNNALSRYAVEELAAIWKITIYLGNEGLIIQTLISKSVPELAEAHNIEINPNISFQEFVEDYRDAMIYRSCSDDPGTCLERFAAEGNLRGVKLMLMKRGHIARGMHGAILHNQDAVIEYLLEQGFNLWDIGAYYAALAGNLKLLKFFEAKAPKRMDWNYIMEGAASKGHGEVVYYAVEKGADKWNQGLKNAAIGGNLNLIAFFTAKGARNWYDALLGAIEGKHQELVEIFAMKVPRHVLQEAVEFAAWQENIAAMQYLATLTDINWNYILSRGISKNNKEIITYAIEQGANDWGRALALATSVGNLDLMQYFYEKGVTQEDLDTALEYAAAQNKIVYLDFLIERGARPSTKHFAYARHNPKVFNYLEERFSIV